MLVALSGSSYFSGRYFLNKYCMNETKTKLQNLGFNYNHLFIMLAALAIFAVLIIPRANIKVFAMFSKAQETEKPLLTYEDVHTQVFAERGLGTDQESEKYLNDIETQFALLDRGEADGKVLGAAIGLDEIPNIDQLFSEEQLNLINVHSVIATNKDSIQTYADRLLKIESYYNTTELFANLNSTDKNLLDKTTSQTKLIVDSMNQIPVPSELVNYHRYNVLYYQTLGKLGQSFSSDEGDLSQYSSALFSLMDRIASFKNEIKTKYNIEI